MTTPNMSLVLPVPSTTTGPLYAQQEVTAFNLVDAHDHTSGRGVPVPTAGLNINADLPIGSNNINGIRSLRLDSQSAALTGAGDVRILYSKNGELAYRDAAGNEVVMTASGSVAGAAGTITGLMSPASASFSSVTHTFTFSADSAKPGKLAISDINLYEYNNATANAVTLKSPASLASAYTLTLPASIPASGIDLLQVDSSGVASHAALSGVANQIAISQSSTAVVLSLPASVITDDFRAGNGSAANPSFRFYNDTSTGMYRPAASKVAFSAGGVTALTLDSAGSATLSGSFLDPISGGVDFAMSNDVKTFSTLGSPELVIDSTRVDVKTAFGMRFDGQANPFKMKVLTGTIGPSGTSSTFTAPSGVIFGAYGFTTGLGSSWGIMEIAAGTTSKIYISVLSSNQVFLVNADSSHTNSYRLVMIYG